MIRKLKEHFNAEFDAVFSFKESTLGQLQGWIAKLTEVRFYFTTSKLNNKLNLHQICGHSADYNAANFVWTAEEDPEIDLKASFGTGDQKEAEGIKTTDDGPIKKPLSRGESYARKNLGDFVRRLISKLGFLLGSN